MNDLQVCRGYDIGALDSVSGGVSSNLESLAPSDPSRVQSLYIGG